MEYYIEDITYKQNGQTRQDGKYPNRIHSIISFIREPIIGEPVYFEYIKINEDGGKICGTTRTSVCNDFDGYSEPGYLYIYTKNSIYKLKEIRGEEE